MSEQQEQLPETITCCGVKLTRRKGVEDITYRNDDESENPMRIAISKQVSLWNGGYRSMLPVMFPPVAIGDSHRSVSEQIAESLTGEAIREQRTRRFLDRLLGVDL